MIAEPLAGGGYLTFMAKELSRNKISTNAQRMRSTHLCHISVTSLARSASRLPFFVQEPFHTLAGDLILQDRTNFVNPKTVTCRSDTRSRCPHRPIFQHPCRGGRLCPPPFSAHFTTKPSRNHKQYTTIRSHSAAPAPPAPHPAHPSHTVSICTPSRPARPRPRCS